MLFADDGSSVIAGSRAELSQVGARGSEAYLAVMQELAFGLAALPMQSSRSDIWDLVDAVSSEFFESERWAILLRGQSGEWQLHAASRLQARFGSVPFASGLLQHQDVLHSALRFAQRDATIFNEKCWGDFGHFSAD